jgi:hypothetical protein
LLVKTQRTQADAGAGAGAQPASRNTKRSSKACSRDRINVDLARRTIAISSARRESTTTAAGPAGRREGALTGALARREPAPTARDSATIRTGMDCARDSAKLGRGLAQRRLASVTRPAVLGVLVGLLLGGCASTCRSGRTGGWLSSWGNGGGSAFLLGLHRAWGECADRTPASSQRSPDPGPAPSPEPASEVQVSPPSAPR